MTLVLWLTVLSQTPAVAVTFPGNQPRSSTTLSSTAVLGGRIVFAATDANGTEPWVTDGTPAGTRRLADISPGESSGVHPTGVHFAVVGSRAVFAATSEAGSELWVTDGTPGGTQLLLRPVSLFPPTVLGVFNGQAVFVVYPPSGSNFSELWRSDGTRPGTVLWFTTTAFRSAVSPGYQAGSLFFFGASDTTSGGMLGRVDSFGSGVTMRLGSSVGVTVDLRLAAVFDDTLYFGCLLAGYRELCTANALGQQVFDLDNGPSTSSAPNALARVGTRVFVSADTGLYSATTGAFTLVPGSGTVTRDVFALGNRVIYVARSAAAGDELWQSDGTMMGTGLFADLNPGTAGSSPRGFALLGSDAVFIATGPAGDQLWRAPPMGAPTVLHTFAAGSSGAGRLVSMADAGLVAFRLNDGATGLEPWVTNGTGAGTRLLRNILDDSLGSPLTKLRASGTHLYFFGAASELVETDGTDAGTRRLQQLAGASQPQWAVDTGNGVVFSLATSTSFAVYRTDGTDAGTWPLATSTSDRHLDVGELPGQVLFSQGGELWSSDGRDAGRLAAAPRSPRGFTPFGARVAFAAVDDAGAELWLSDGTAAGTTSLDLVAGKNGSSAQPLAEADAGLFLTLTNTSAGSELWVTNGTVAGSRLVEDISGGSSSARVRFPAVVGGKLYFTIENAGTSVIWESDGTPAGTRALFPAPHGMEFLVGAGRALLFNGSTTATGAELFEYYPGAATALLVADLNPGTNGSNPRAPVILGNRAWFAATRDGLGQVLWAMDIDTTAPMLTPMVAGTMGQDMFYTSNVTVTFTAVDAESQVAFDCPPVSVSADTTTFVAACTAYSMGGATTAAVPVRRDANPPILACALDDAISVGTPLPVRALAVDTLDPAPTLSSTPDAGSLLAAGVHLVTVSAEDQAGNRSQCSYSVTVSGAAGGAGGGSAGGGAAGGGSGATAGGGAGSCTRNSDCSSGLVCLDARCVTLPSGSGGGTGAQCVRNAECSSGQVCLDGACSAPSNGGCGCSSGADALLALAALLMLRRRRRTEPAFRAR